MGELLQFYFSVQMTDWMGLSKRKCNLMFMACHTPLCHIQTRSPPHNLIHYHSLNQGHIHLLPPPDPEP
ncbi:hypothetical protein OIU77_013257 [Salix suchowensis]|uniref:Uncharacterized protein n=1 Tax=Salix suchowensis TaxID=1278906 RepID=A0ABQ8ZTE3_9ROSI|nr:hypothetical protein OIU77_013257 [Salix suchowensis]